MYMFHFLCTTLYKDASQILSVSMQQLSSVTRKHKQLAFEADTVLCMMKKNHPFTQLQTRLQNAAVAEAQSMQ